MIGIDTNVLLRFYEADDPAQSARAQSAIRANAPVFVSELVLIEFVWVCESHFNLDHKGIRRRLQVIIDAPEFEFAQRDAVERAVSGFGSKKSDFADWLIGQSNRQYGCETTLTFDADAARTPAFTLLEAK